MDRRGSKRGGGRGIPKSRAKKPREGDGVAEPAAPTSPKELEPVKEVEVSSGDGEPSSASPLVKDLKEVDPSSADQKVRPSTEVEVSSGDGEPSSASPLVKDLKEVDPSSADHRDQVHLPHTMDSEKGTAIMLTRKGDRDVTDSYTVKKDSKQLQAYTKQLKASGSPASSSSSQDSSSTSKHRKYKKLTPRDLDELAEQSKKMAEQQRKEEQRQQWQRQQQERQQQHLGLGQQEDPRSMESRMKNFLGSFVKSGTEGVFYEKKVKFMRDLCCWELEVDFCHILHDEFELAVDILNYSRPEELQAAARGFIKMHVSDEDKQAADWSSMTFISMPDNLVRVTELLKNPDKLVDVYINGFNLSILSASLLGGFSEHILDTHALLGRTWNGDYNLSDMYVLNRSQFVIKKPSFTLEGDQTVQFLSKKSDMNRLTELFTPCVDLRKPEENKNGEPPKASDLPLFYMQFCNDLRDVSMDDISKPYFRAYILNSPALKTPQARHDLVCASHLALKRPVSPDVYALVSENPCPGGDWRLSVSKSAHAVLREVYHYKENDGGEQAASGSSSGLEQAASEPSQRETSQREPFGPNIKGIITYDRNLKNHGSKKGLFRSIAEVEVFASSNLFQYLPKFVKGLFYMAHNSLMKDFAEILTQYKYARVRTIDGSEVIAAPKLSFWE